MSRSSTLASEIRRRLAEQSEPVAQSSAPAQDAANRMRATKDGELIEPGQPVPLDENGRPKPHLVVPDGTFHAEPAA